MKFVFKIVNQNKQHVGFIKDPLLNLSYFSKEAEYYDIKDNTALTLKLNKFQQQLNSILSRSLNTTPTSKLYEQIYQSNYKEYKLGELHVIPKSIKRYMF